MGDERMNVAEMLCDTARVERYGQRLFCIGPNVGRINFLSQQIRALNLVWALHANGRIEPNFKVAVIGGGIAGLTAAVALRAYDCTVRVFDKGARPMHRQRGTKHRHIFPNINWWPHHEQDLALTTALPFLDWHLDQCDRVIEILDTDWKRLAAESGDDLQFIGGKTINRAEPDEFDDYRLTLRSTANESWEGFDVAIVASGFGEERTHLNIPFKSYWEFDGLEAYRDGTERKTPIVVSGFGDGGQIDALRLAYEGFGDGRLSFTAAQYVETCNLGPALAAAEKEEQGSRDYPGIAELIGTDDGCAPLRELLDGALHKENRIVVITDNRIASPYASPAAPIHKLLIAYAHYRKRLTIRKGELVNAPGGGDFAYQLEGQGYDLQYHHIVIRHGAHKATNPMLINMDEWRALELAQQRAQGYSFRPAWGQDEPLAVPDGWPCPVNDEHKYINSRKSLARRAVYNMGSSGQVDAWVDRFIVYDHDVPYRPKTLFGKPVEYRPGACEPTAPELE